MGEQNKIVDTAKIANIHFRSSFKPMVDHIRHQEKYRDAKGREHGLFMALNLLSFNKPQPCQKQNRAGAV